MRTNILDTKNKIGGKVELYGWVWGRRDHGKIIFIDLGDRSGQVQVVFTPNNKELYEIADQVRQNWVLKIIGTVGERPEKMINPDLETGKVEVQPESIKILAESETPPFALDTDGREIGDENRMKYRYLDLKRKRMQNNLTLRHKVIKHIRDFLDEKDFLEIETPILSKSTPEGARDFVVPSRLYNGKFYALPQAPQQYKQLLMISGLERYFQIARCFRDEDSRGDRQPEFTQMDLEMSFVEREDVMKINEEMLISIVKNVTPEKKIQEVPFPRLTYKEAIEKYGSDRPDLRKDKDDPNLLAFCWVIDFPFFEKTDKGDWTFTHNPFSAPKPEFKEQLLIKKDVGEILTSQYDVTLNGFEIGGGSIRNHESEALKAVFEIMGISEKNIESNFGHMLKAFSFGAPPHGGIAWGLDRIVALLANEPNIREVMAFPKTRDNRDLMMDGPSELSKEQLDELGIQIKK